MCMLINANFDFLDDFDGKMSEANAHYVGAQSYWA